MKTAIEIAKQKLKPFNEKFIADYKILEAMEEFADQFKTGTIKTLHIRGDSKSTYRICKPPKNYLESLRNRIKP